MNDLKNFIFNNHELKELYYTDSIFKRSVDACLDNDYSLIDSLTYILLNGYKAKNNISNEYIKHLQSCTSNIVLRGKRAKVIDWSDCNCHITKEWLDEILKPYMNKDKEGR